MNNSVRRTARAGWALLVLGFAGSTGPGLAQQAEWPRIVRSGSTEIVVYEPQVDSLADTSITAQVAIAVKRPADKTPLFGAMRVTATLDVDRNLDVARIRTVKVERIRFPDSPQEAVDALAKFLETSVADWDLTLSLASVRASLEVPDPADDAEYKNDPPRIIVRDSPAILVTVDGAPRLQDVGNSGFQRVVNTPFPVIFDPRARKFWLYGSSVWFSTADLLQGSWKHEKKVPAEIARLVKVEDAEKDPATPAGKVASAKELAGAAILVTTEPAELVVTEGAPQFAPLVPGGELLYVTNTGSDLFLEVATQKRFLVLSGRWYAAPGLNGPWSYVPPDQLPAKFGEVPAESPKASVRAFVPGTGEAKDAVLDTVIPQTAAVKRGEAQVQASYDGNPRFAPIAGTQLQFAENTASQVIVSGTKYFLCEQGVWYVSKSPTGPWEVSEERPEGIDKVPASSPVYNTKYVHIYESTPEVVYVGYLPGYLWTFPYRGIVIYGSGWRYPAWVGPVYFPRPLTWGFHVRYTPWGGWSFGMSWNAGWFGFSSFWGPGWGGGWYGGGFWRPGFIGGGGWFGPGGYRPIYPRPPLWRPGLGTRPVLRPRPGGWNNIYTRPGSPGISATRPAVRPAPRPGAVTRPANRLPNNVFADPDGNLYRNTGGSWEKWDQKSWKPALPSAPVTRPAPGTPAPRPSIPAVRPAPVPRPAPPAVRPAPPPVTRPGVRPAMPRGGGGLGSSSAARRRAARPRR